MKRQVWIQPPAHQAVSHSVSHSTRSPLPLRYRVLCRHERSKDDSAFPLFQKDRFSAILEARGNPPAEEYAFLVAI